MQDDKDITKACALLNELCNFARQYEVELDELLIFRLVDAKPKPFLEAN